MKSVALVATLLFVASSAMRPCELPNCYRPYRYHGPAHDEDNSVGYARNNAPRPVYADEDNSVGYARNNAPRRVYTDEDNSVGYARNNAPMPVYADEDDSLGIIRPIRIIWGRL